MVSLKRRLSCGTNPMSCRSSAGATFFVGTPSIRISPSCGSYSRGIRSISALFPLPVAPTTPNVAPAGTLKLTLRRTQRGSPGASDVSKLDGAARFCRWQMLTRLFTVDGRANIEDLGQTPHRRIAALKQVDDPAERDHRPREHGEVHPKRHERAHGNRALDRQRSSHSQNDHRAESPEKRE